MKIRFSLLILIFWSIGAWFGWAAVVPETSLVAQRQGNSGTAQFGDFNRPDIDDARKVLETAVLWGVQRDGKPFPPPVSKEEAQKKVDWQLLGSAIRPKERYILIRVANNSPVTIKEGDALPDGGRLLRVTKKMVTIQTPEGDKRQIQTYSE